MQRESGAGPAAPPARDEAPDVAALRARMIADPRAGDRYISATGIAWEVEFVAASFICVRSLDPPHPRHVAALHRAGWAATIGEAAHLGDAAMAAIRSRSECGHAPRLAEDDSSRTGVGSGRHG